MADDLHDLIYRMSVLSGRSKAGIITDMLYEIKPTLELTLDALMAVKQENRMNDSLLELIRLANEGSNQVEILANELRQQYED